MGAATEAMVMIVVDVEARRLFLMKGAAALGVAARTDQLDPPSHDLRRGQSRLQFFQEFRGDRHFYITIPLVSDFGRSAHVSTR